MSSKDESTDVQLDISQFEGHSPGPWDDEHSPYFSEHEDNADVLTVKTEPAFDSEKTWVNQRLAASAPELLEEVKRLHEEIDELKTFVNGLKKKMYVFKEALWHEALYDESENVVGVEAYPGDKKREKKVFFISCDLVDEMYGFFQQHGRLDLSKNASD